MELNDIKIIPLVDTIQLLKISDAEYFSSKYANYISNSRLGLINPQQDGSPDKFFNGFSSEFSSSFQLGSAVHELILQPEAFELAPCLNKPTAKLGVLADILYPIWLTKTLTREDLAKGMAQANYYKDKLNDTIEKKIYKECVPYFKARKKLKVKTNKELIFLDNKSYDTVVNCIDALNANKAVVKLLRPTGLINDPVSLNEMALLMDVEIVCPNGKNFILHLKSKLDNFTIDLENSAVVINDVKTIGKVVNEITNNAERFHYYREIAMYMYLLKQYVAKEYEEDFNYTANYLVVSTIPQYYTKVQPLTNIDIAKGMKEFSTLLRYVAYQIGYENREF